MSVRIKRTFVKSFFLDNPQKKKALEYGEFFTDLHLWQQHRETISSVFIAFVKLWLEIR